MAIATQRLDFKHLKQSARKDGVQKFTVGALIAAEDRFLVLRRKPKGPNEGKWEPPGGKVEKGESLHTAVVREVYEETGLTYSEQKAHTVYGWEDVTLLHAYNPVIIR